MTYDNFCNQHAAQLPLFLQPWWLEAVTNGGRWHGHVWEGNGEIDAIWPVYTKRKWRFNYHTHPPLTPYFGFWSHKDEGFSAKYFNEMLKSLPPSFYFTMAMPVLPEKKVLEQAGFELIPYFTYHIAPAPEAERMAALHSTTRQMIRKAQQQLIIQTATSATPLLHLIATDDKHPYRYLLPVPPSTSSPITHHASRNNQSSQLATDHSKLTTLFEACLARQQGEILTATDQNGQLHAAAFFVWDANTTYYLIAAMDKRFRQSGAARLLIWQGIKNAAKRGQVFDFEGGMPENLSRLYASFGAKRFDYWRVVRYRPAFLSRLIVLPIP
jgi:Acetyltransferase (GNAT) domain